MPQAGSLPRAEIKLCALRFDEDVVALGLHRVASELDARIVEVRSGRDVVLPSVPWADDGGAVQFSFCQWASAMLAGVVDRVKLAARVEQRDLFSTGLDQFAGA